MIVRKPKVVVILMLLCGFVLLAGCGTNGDNHQDSDSFIQVKAWEGWVKVEMTLEQESTKFSREESESFVVEVILNDQTKYTTSSKWFGEAEDGAFWEICDHYLHTRESTWESFWESVGSGTGFGYANLEIDEETGRYLISVGASLEIQSKTTILENGRTTIELDTYEYESFAGNWTGWIDLPKSGKVLKGKIEFVNEEIGTKQIIQWELRPKGTAP